MKSVPMCRNNNNNGSSTGTSPANAVSSGRVHRKRGDLEDEKIQKYLAKLKDLVPLIPKDKRISRLEVIHHVIDYICDLEDMLENHRSVNADAVHSAAAAVMLSSSVAAVRQPLGIISTPNALATAAAAAVAVTAQPLLQQPSTEQVSVVKNTFNKYLLPVFLPRRENRRGASYPPIQFLAINRTRLHRRRLSLEISPFSRPNSVCVCVFLYCYSTHRHIGTNNEKYGSFQTFRESKIYAYNIITG